MKKNYIKQEEFSVLIYYKSTKNDYIFMKNCGNEINHGKQGTVCVMVVVVIIIIVSKFKHKVIHKCCNHHFLFDYTFIYNSL